MRAFFIFPSQDRLKKGWQFDQVFRTGRRESGALVRLLFMVSPDGQTRYGVAVGKQQGTSPLRSRGKRLLRESLRRLRPWVKDGFWIVCMIKSNALGSGAKEVYQDMAKLFNRAGLLKSEWPGPDWFVDRRQGRR